jgi:hypothetical protein
MKIIQPDDMKINMPNGSLNIKWDKNFGNKTTETFQKVQKFIDSECIRLMTPYMPFKNGLLAESAKLGTVIGSGEIHQNIPYAHYMYYGKVYGPNIPVFENGIVIGYFSPKGKAKHPTGADIKYKTKHPQAGKMWFERMKADHKDEILRGAAKLSGGKAE